MASITVVDASGALSFTAAAGGETVNGSGMSGALTVFGGSDSEAIIGGSGADTLVGGTGSDTLTGGAGADFFSIGVGGNAGVKYVITDFSSSDVLSVGGDIAFAAASIAAATGNSFTLSNGATVTFANVLVSSIASSIKLTGTGVVSSASVPAAVSAGGDTLFGGSGGVLLNVAGDAFFGGASSAETVTGNSVSGLAIQSTGSFGLLTAAGDTLLGSAGAETLTGSAGRVTLFGTTNGDTLYGGAATHTITGGAGNDTLIGGAGNDTLTGGAGNDYLDGGIGTDVAVYSGPRASYLMTPLAGGAIQITDERAGSPDGTDTVSNVEEFQFSDGLFAVQDTTPPVLTPVASQTDEATSPAGAVATFAATATDVVDGTDPVVFTENGNVVHSGDTFGLGVNTITASATDAAGNTASETFTITVKDTTPPVLTPVASQTDEATSPAGAVATFAATASDLVDGTDPVVFKEGNNVVHSGGTFGLGVNTITASATDAAGNTASETFTITVKDTTPPVLTPVASQTDEATSPAGAVATFAATASDLVDGTDPVVFKEGNNVVHSGGTFGLGVNTITASATDAAGNTASETFTITVKDTTPPVLTPVASQTDEATSPAGAVATFAATASDLVDGTDPVVFKEGNNVVHSGGTFGLGVNTITASATDAAGNTASETFTITVKDTTPPVLTPVASQTDEATSPAGAVATFAATASDLVDGTDPVVFKEGNNVVHSGGTFGLGVNTITASATDAAGNTASETFTITVKDTTPPVLTPVASQTDEATSPAGAVATFAATASDLVDGTDPVVFKEGNNVVHSGGTFGLGVNTITASATDAAGNTASETFTITVSGGDTIGGSGADTIIGSGADTIIGSGADTLVGGASGSAETVVGNSVSGLAINSTGSFTLFTAAGDTLSGSAGADTITGSAGSVSGLAINSTGSFTLFTAAGDTLSGSAGADTITGSAGSVSGLAINSTGSFTLFTAAGDTLSGSAGAETITGSAGSVTLVGTTNGDTLYGGANTHTITGGAGNDTLTGGAGNDYLDGGIGTDVAVYSGPRASYLMTPLAGGAIQITDERAGSPDGTDTVSNVEEFQFSDGLFTVQDTTPPVPPTVQSIVATPLSGDLGPGKSVMFTVTMSQAVTLAGVTPSTTPYLVLNDGGKAIYQNGSGTDLLTFAYTVGALNSGQNTPALAVNGFNPNGASVYEAGFSAIAADLSGVTAFTGGPQIDTTAPAVTEHLFWDTGISSTDGITSNDTLTGSGDPAAVVTLTEGGTPIGTTTANATGAWTFTFTPSGLAQGVNTIVASETDGAGNTGTASLTFTLETTAPKVTSIAANPANGELAAGRAVTLTVTFDSPVLTTATLIGKPYLLLNDGGRATYASGSGTDVLTFTYVVTAGQSTPNLAVTGFSPGLINAVGLAPLLAGAVTNPGGTLAINPPVVTHVLTSPASGEVTTGQAVSITVDTSTPVTVTGAPELLLNDGGIAGYDAVHSSAPALVFDYTPAVVDVTTNLAVSGIELPTGSAIADQKGNTAVMSSAAGNLGLQVNTANTGPAGTPGGSFAIAGNSQVELFGVSAASVTFAPGSTGTLLLDQSSAFAGTVAGLALGNYLDLADLAYQNNVAPLYTPNGGNTGGSLMVKEGASTVNIALLGSYLAGSFVASSDGHGGTLVTDPPSGQQPLLVPPHA